MSTTSALLLCKPRILHVVTTSLDVFVIEEHVGSSAGNVPGVARAVVLGLGLSGLGGAGWVGRCCGASVLRGPDWRGRK